jgi:hypothetical protein
MAGQRMIGTHKGWRVESRRKMNGTFQGSAFKDAAPDDRLLTGQFSGLGAMKKAYERVCRIVDEREGAK